jgi:hypothetical protein
MCDYTFLKIAPNPTEKVEMPTQYSASFAYQEVVNVHRDIDDIQKAESILQINKGNLASLTDIRSRLDQVKASQTDILNDESLMQDIYSSLRVYLTIPFDPFLSQLDQQIGALEQEVRALWDKYVSLKPSFLPGTPPKD